METVWPLQCVHERSDGPHTKKVNLAPFCGANVTQIQLNGSSLRSQDANVFMPGFGEGYSDTGIATLSNYVIGHFGGRQGVVKADGGAARRKSFKRL